MKPNRNDFKVQNLQVPKLRQLVLKGHMMTSGLIKVEYIT